MVHNFISLNHNSNWQLSQSKQGVTHHVTCHLHLPEPRRPNACTYVYNMFALPPVTILPYWLNNIEFTTTWNTNMFDEMKCKGNCMNKQYKVYTIMLYAITTKMTFITASAWIKWIGWQGMQWCILGKDWYPSGSMYTLWNINSFIMTLSNKSWNKLVVTV